MLYACAGKASWRRRRVTLVPSISMASQAAADGRELGQDLIGGAARNAFMLLLWRMNGLDQIDPDGRELQALADARQRLTALLEATLEFSQQVRSVLCCVQPCLDAGRCGVHMSCAVCSRVSMLAGNLLRVGTTVSLVLLGSF